VIINNAGSRCDVDFWAKHLENTEDNERAELREIRELNAGNLREALDEMKRLARANPRVKNFMYHADFNPRLNEHLSDAERDRAFEIFENERGIPPNTARIVMEHVKDGRKHWHVMWLRVDENGRPFSDKLDAQVAHRAGEKIAHELGLEKVISPLTREPGTPRPERAPKPWEMYRAGQSGITLESIEADMAQLRPQCATGKEFHVVLDLHDFILARGDKMTAGQPTLMIIDPAGDDHALARRLKIKTKELNDFMRDVDRAALPDIRQAKEMQQERFIAKLEADRDYLRDEIKWEEALNRAGLEHEERERRFIEPKEETRVGGIAEPGESLASELFERYINDLDAYHRDRPRLAEQTPTLAVELDRRISAAIDQEIAAHFPPFSLDDLWPGHQLETVATEEAQPHKQEPLPQPEQPARAAAPEVGKTQAEIRLARSLSPGPQSFANALEDRGFILAITTADDIQRDIERLTDQWEQRRQNPQAWMEHNEGYAKLKPEFQESARRSFDAWEKQQEQKRQKHQEQHGNRAVLIAEPTADDIQKRLESYVKYVQGKWAEGPKSQLERATGGLAVVTPFGSVYTLTPRNTGLDRDELAEYLKGLDRNPLLSVTDAQAVMQEIREQRRAEWKFDRREEWLAKQPLGRAAAEIRLAYSLTQTGPHFAEAIEDKGLALACMSEAEAERLNRWERQRLKEQRNAAAPAKEGEAERRSLSFDEYAERLNKRERQRNAPAPPKQREAPKERDLDAFEKYRAGELVVINQYGAIFQLTAATTGAHAREREERLNEIDRAALLSVTAAQAAMRDYQEHRREERREIRQQEWEQQRAARQAERDRQQISDGPQNLKGPARHIWNACTRSDSATAFLAALDEQYIALATPTKEEAQRSHMNASFAREVERFSPEYRDGDTLAVTLEGRVYKLTPRNTGMTREDMEAFLAPLDRSQLHGIAVTQESQQKRLNEIHWPIMPQPEKPQQHATGLTMQEAPATSPALHFQDAARRTAEPEAAQAMPSDLRGTAAEIWTAYNIRTVDREWQRVNVDGTKETQRDRITLKGGRDPLKFGHALDQRGLILARATKEEAEQSQKDAEHYKGFGDSYRPVYQEGEFVVINRRGDVYSLNKRTTGHAAKEVQAFLNKAEWKALPGIDAGRQTMKARSDERLAAARDRAGHWDAIRLKNATRKHGPGQGRTGEPTVSHLARPLDTAARASRHAIGGVFGALGKLADGFSLDALTPKEKYEAAKRDARNEHEADKNGDYAAYIAELSAAWRRDHQRQAEQQRQQREPERER